MSADIDIDFADRNQLLELIQHTPARQLHQGQVRRHNSGVYVTNIPQDPVNQCAAVDYKVAEELGYFKIDLLNMSVYQLITSPEHYATTVAQEPEWSRLWTDTEWTKQLVHVGNYTDLLKEMQPDSIPRMAAVWDGDESQGYTFKKSHSISYAMLVALHMNLLTPSDEQV